MPRPLHLMQVVRSSLSAAPQQLQTIISRKWGRLRARGCAVNDFERERINAMKKMFSGREGWNTERNLS